MRPLFALQVFDAVAQNSGTDGKKGSGKQTWRDDEQQQEHEEEETGKEAECSKFCGEDKMPTMPLLMSLLFFSSSERKGCANG